MTDLELCRHLNDCGLPVQGCLEFTLCCGGERPIHLVKEAEGEEAINLYQQLVREVK